MLQITDVDDNAPVFAASSYNFSVAENNARGQAVGRVSASDADAGPNGRVAYSLGHETDESSGAAWFAVDPLSGVISARVSFDREFVDQFNFTVYASTSAVTTSQVLPLLLLLLLLATTVVVVGLVIVVVVL